MTIFFVLTHTIFAIFQARRRNEIRELNNSSSSDGEHADKRRHPKKPKFGQKTPNASSAAAATSAKEGKLNLMYISSYDIFFLIIAFVFESTLHVL